MKHTLSALLLVGFLSFGSCITPMNYNFEKAQHKTCKKELKKLRNVEIDRVSIDYERDYAINDKRHQIDHVIEIQTEWDIPQEQAQQVLELLRQHLRLPLKYSLISSCLNDPNQPTYYMDLKFYQGDKLIARINPLNIGPDTESSYQLNAVAKAELIRIIEEQLKTKGFSSPFPKQ